MDAWQAPWSIARPSVANIWRDLTGRALRPDPDTARLPSWALVLFNGFLIVLGVAVLLGIIAR